MSFIELVSSHWDVITPSIEEEGFDIFEDEDE